tara:strand:+ start:1609 stop:1872 length:264 start_codon:yes stop_codon:yes gene_type:complete
MGDISVVILFVVVLSSADGINPKNIQTNDFLKGIFVIVLEISSLFFILLFLETNTPIINKMMVAMVAINDQYKNCLLRFNSDSIKNG